MAALAHLSPALGGAMAAALAIALIAGWRERRRKRRVKPDAVGLIAWPTVQFLALVALAMLVSVAFALQ